MTFTFDPLPGILLSTVYPLFDTFDASAQESCTVLDFYCWLPVSHPAGQRHDV